MKRHTMVRADRGFTLLEMLVVMVLMSVIMLGLLSALRNMAQTETAIDRQLERLDQIRVARSFVQQTLARVSAVTTDTSIATGKKSIPFSATGDSLTWVGILPARPDVGGRHFFRLAVEDVGGGAVATRALVLRYAPWNPDAQMPNWPSAEARVLLRDISRITVQAQGLPPQDRSLAEPWPRGWQDGWPVGDALPEHVRIAGYYAGSNVFALTSAMYALPGGDKGFGGTSFGGGVR
jgi:general secretion pathway protein J